MLDVSLKAISDKKAAEMASSMLESGHELHRKLKSETVVMDNTIKQSVEACAQFVEVMANLDAHKEMQGAMQKLLTGLQEELDWRTGGSFATSLAELLNKQWAAQDSKSFKLDLDEEDLKLISKLQIRGRSDMNLI